MRRLRVPWCRRLYKWQCKFCRRSCPFSLHWIPWLFRFGNLWQWEARDALHERILEEMMGYDEKLRGRFYGLVRSGLVHKYFIGQKSIIHMREKSQDWKRISHWSRRCSLLRLWLLCRIQECLFGVQEQVLSNDSADQNSPLNLFESALREQGWWAAGALFQPAPTSSRIPPLPFVTQRFRSVKNFKNFSKKIRK